MNEPAWAFGVAPLAQTTRAAGLLRKVAGRLLALEAEHADVADLIEQLRDADRRLTALGPHDLRPRIGDAAPEGRVYLDHSRHIGGYNPAFPEYDLTVEGDRARGSVRFPLLYEGPPGVVHGGFLAVFFDAAMQHHSCDLGVAGKTAGLSLRYHRPTPIETELRFELTRTVDEHRIAATGSLFRGDEPLCEAEMTSVAGRRTALPDVSPRRDAS